MHLHVHTAHHTHMCVCAHTHTHIHCNFKGNNSPLFFLFYFVAGPPFVTQAGFKLKILLSPVVQDSKPVPLYSFIFHLLLCFEVSSQVPRPASNLAEDDFDLQVSGLPFLSAGMIGVPHHIWLYVD